MFSFFFFFDGAGLGRGEGGEELFVCLFVWIVACGVLFLLMVGWVLLTLFLFLLWILVCNDDLGVLRRCVNVNYKGKEIDR